MWSEKKRIVWALVAVLCCLIAVAVGTFELTNRTDAAAFDLDNQKVSPLRPVEGKAVVLIFISVDCPISNQYAPEIQRLEAAFHREGVKFWLVYPHADATPEIVRQHTREFGYHLGVLRDPKHTLVKISQARVTPEAAVFLPDGKLIYHGAIDDRYVDFGVQRRQPTRQPLEEILTALIKGESLQPSTAKAVGCLISD